MRKLEITIHPPSWNTIIYKLTNDYLNNISMRTLVCGSKGVGKSSLIRYVINSHFNIKSVYKQSPVGFIDCDLGQPELTVPGMISLFLLDGPILSSNHFNIHTFVPKLSYYFGEVTSRSEPERVCLALRGLLKAYTEIRESHIKSRLSSEQQPKPLNNNSFSALLEPIADSESEEKSQLELQSSFPLVINTDGFVRYMGAEVLSTIVEICQPTHILQIASERSEVQSSIWSVAKEVNENVEILSIDSPLLMVETSFPRLQPVELRNFRLLSYFLGRQVFDANEKLIAFRNASLTKGGNNGALALELLSISPYIIPFSRIVFNLVGDDIVSPTQILSAVNASIVGLSLLSESVTEPKLTRLRVAQSGKIIELRYYSPLEVFETMGLGIVRGIDMKNEVIVLTTPTNLDPDAMIVLTVGGSLTLPFYLGYGEGFPSCPYYSSEFTGEGATQVKPRTNLKRKNQNS